MCAGRGRLRKGKGDAQDDQELQVAKEEFDKIAGFLSSHLLSLERDCTRSLITQAARHHAAQVLLLFSMSYSVITQETYTQLFVSFVNSLVSIYQLFCLLPYKIGLTAKSGIYTSKG
jgi:hypothetical protein